MLGASSTPNTFIPSECCSEIVVRSAEYTRILVIKNQTDQVIYLDLPLRLRFERDVSNEGGTVESYKPFHPCADVVEVNWLFYFTQ